MVYNRITEQDPNKNIQKKEGKQNEKNRGFRRRKQFLLHTEEARLGG